MEMMKVNQSKMADFVPLIIDREMKNEICSELITWAGVCGVGVQGLKVHNDVNIM